MDALGFARFAVAGHDRGAHLFLWAKLRTWGHDETAFTPAALAEYQRCLADPAVIHASRKDKCVTTPACDKR